MNEKLSGGIQVSIYKTQTLMLKDKTNKQNHFLNHNNFNESY